MHAPRATAAVLALLALGSPGLLAQQGGEGPGNGSAPTTVPAEDFGKWERLGNAVLSPDGRWLATPISRVSEEDELRVRPVSDPDSVVVVPYGSGPTFSADGRWLAYGIGMSEDARERLQDRGEPVRDDVGVLDLGTGEAVTVEDVSSFAFSADGRWLAMRRYPPEGEREAEGVDLVVRELATGTDVNFGNVSEFAWQDRGGLLAMVVDAEGGAGNGVRLWDPATGRLRVLDSRPARYSGLTWREESDDLAVFRAVEEAADADEEAGEAAETEAGGGEAGSDPAETGEWADTAQVVLAFTGVGGEGGRTRTLEPGEADGFPDGYRVVPWEDLRWSEDGRTLFLGIQERTPLDPCDVEEGRRDDDDRVGGDDTGDDAPEAGVGDDEGEAECPDEDEIPTVEIWHARDVDIVPTQKVRASRDRRDNDLVAWHLDGGVVRLEDELTEDVQIVEGASFAVGTDETPYELERMFGPSYRDVWIVDLETGEKTKALEHLEYFMGASPGGGYLLFLADDEYRTYDVASGDTTCITCGLPTSFVDLEDDHTVEQKPPYFLAGWLEDDRAVLLYDEYDAWRVRPDGSGGERVTAGADDNVQHRLVRLDFDEDAIDPDAPRYWSLYDDWKETWGYGRSDRLGGEVEVLSMEEARVYGLEKADSADVYAWMVQDFEDSPDVFVGDARLEGRQVTRTNPFQDDYLWGRSELITYVNEHGDTLQGSLYYPAGWEAGRTYPMITYIYEIRSGAVRSYDVPSERDYYNFQTWVQDGYFVFQPDIVYRDRNPGLSAVENIVPAVEAVIETGMVDPDAIGLVGHSWGGYQTTFFVTQSDLFAAAVAGAPLTNLFSMYLSVYWNSGGTDARIFEISQGRMEVPFWEDEASYRANSPVFHIEDMETPLLMAQGTEDGAVDFNQGVEFYNAARRAGKDFVFLVYNDENHGFRQEANQLDYHRRIDEWFGHYLKGEPAPAWMEEGVPYLEQPGGREGGR